MYKFQHGYGVFCECNDTLQTMLKAYLFHGRDRRCVLPERTCDIQTPDIISHIGVRLWALQRQIKKRSRSQNNYTVRHKNTPKFFSSWREERWFKHSWYNWP